MGQPRPSRNSMPRHRFSSASETIVQPLKTGPEVMSWPPPPTLPAGRLAANCSEYRPGAKLFERLHPFPLMESRRSGLRIDIEHQ